MHLIDISGPIVIQTRKGRNLPIIRRPEEPLRMQQAYKKRFAGQFPDALMRRDATGEYNCYGLVFAIRRAWVVEEGVDMVVADDGLKRLRNEADVMPGDVVFYREGNEVVHVACVLRVDNIGRIRVPYVLSKWGSGPEYMHSVARHPYEGATIEYWSERP